MLNIIHRLKSGIFPALFFLTSANVLAQPLIIPPGHWQDGMAVGVTEFSGTLYVPEVSWHWQPRAVRMSSPDAVQAGLTTGNGGMVSEGRAGFLYPWRAYHIADNRPSRTAAVSDITSGGAIISPDCGPGGACAWAGALRGNLVHDAPFAGMAGQYHCGLGLECGQRRGDAGGRTAGKTSVMAGERL